MAWLPLVGSAALVLGCSWVYDPDKLPTGQDIDGGVPIIDADVADVIIADAPTSSIFPYTPSNVGADESRPRLDVIIDCQTTFDTDTLAWQDWCGDDQPQAYVATPELDREVAVIPMSSLVVSSAGSIVFRGSRPVAVIVFGSATIEGSLLASAALDVGGPGSNQDCGAGAGGGNAADGNGNGSGGAGGTFALTGAAGGDSNTVAGGLPVGLAIGNASLVPLQGGCGGGVGGESEFGTAGGLGGAGGGALQLSAASSLTLTGTMAAAGGGGLGGVRRNGGGGGGSGGALLLEANTVTITGAVTVNGGGGGEGGRGNTSCEGEPNDRCGDGANGAAASTVPAAGGSGSSNSGGDGGNGGSAQAAAIGGDNGIESGGGNYGGGGGGGGGIGRIRVNAVVSCVVDGPVISGSVTTGNADCIPPS
jgi:hypothetical protein